MSYIPPTTNPGLNVSQPQTVLSPSEWSELVTRQRFNQMLPESKSSLFGGIQVRPKNIRFATQNKGEKVFILLRKHWFTNSSWIFNTVIYSFLPLIAGWILSILNFNLFDLFSARVYFILTLTYYSLIFTNALRHFVDWYFNLYIVTNQRVIDYDFSSFISKGASETALENIQDVKEEAVGFFPGLLDYGDVQVYSAADRSVITFHAVPNYTFVRDVINDLGRIVKETQYGNN